VSGERIGKHDGIEGLKESVALDGETAAYCVEAENTDQQQVR
jgi:hypothetical protein